MEFNSYKALAEKGDKILLLKKERLENANERYNRISQGLESKDSSSKGSTLNPNEVTTQHTFNPSSHVHGPGGHTH